jgi:hypothetical protein
MNLMLTGGELIVASKWIVHGQLLISVSDSSDSGVSNCSAGASSGGVCQPMRRI